MIRFVFSTVILLGISMLVGCGKEATSTKGKTAEAKGNANETAHSGWWCDEHGIKESECSMCSPKVAKAFQDKKIGAISTLVRRANALYATQV